MGLPNFRAIAPRQCTYHDLARCLVLLSGKDFKRARFTTSVFTYELEWDGVTATFREVGSGLAEYADFPVGSGPHLEIVE